MCDRYTFSISHCTTTQTAPKLGSVAPGSSTLIDVAETSYASCGDLSLAYQLFGDGPVELVFVGPFVSHIELFWTMPEFKAFFDQLATFCRIVMFDKAGVGLSDPIPKVRTLDDRAAEIEAVMDAVGFEKSVIFGMSEGGTASIVFAAKRPERTRALILYGTYAFMATDWDDIDRDPAEVRAHFISEGGEELSGAGADYLPSIEQMVRLQEMGRAARSGWGTGATAKCMFPSVRSIRQLAMFERMSASPGMVRATAESVFRIDIRSILATITVPTLVTHARGDAMPVQSGRYLADHIPGARYLEVDGVDHAPWFTEPDTILTGIEEFLTGSHAAPAQSHRALRTVLFTDMVASTQRAAASGDGRWRAVLHRFGQITAELTQRFGGTVVKSTGDGHLATFDGPTQAIRCAESLRADAETLGIEIRVGIHTGECELLDADIGGLAVHIAARILSQAGAGEILVSRTVRDLVVGSGTSFEDRGSVELRGVPGSWQLLAVDRHGARAGSAEAELASTPTPGPRTTMRRSDRTMEVIAKRTPWILRGMARLGPPTGRRAVPSATSASKALWR
jgi:pimeloyl-ACP methyl ester carboxylesterase/class 3 adenylate cyclase